MYNTNTNSLFLRKSLIIPTTKEQVRQHLGMITKEKKEKKMKEEELAAIIMKETGATKEVRRVAFCLTNTRLLCHF